MPIGAFWSEKSTRRGSGFDLHIRCNSDERSDHERTGYPRSGYGLENACEVCKQYFENAEILGWFLTVPGQPLEANHNIKKIHENFLQRESILS